MKSMHDQARASTAEAAVSVDAGWGRDGNGVMWVGDVASHSVFNHRSASVASRQSQCDSFLDDHILFRDVIMETATTGLDRSQLVDHLGACHHFAKHGIAPALA